MPVVPTYQTGTVRERPLMQQGITTRASAEAFGASAGRGLVALAQGIGQVGEAVQQVKALEDETIVRQKRNEYMRERDQLMYDPETGYMNQQGKNALDQRSTFEQSLRDLRSKYAEGLTGAQVGMFGQAVDALEMDATRSAMVHAGGELKSFVVSEGLAGAENFQMEALRNVGNPAMRDKYTAAALAELQEVYRKQGLSAEEIDLKQRNFLSDTTKKMALTIAGSDPIAAEQFINDNADRLDPVTLADLRDGPLKTKALAAKGERNAMALIAGLPTERTSIPRDERDDSGAIATPPATQSQLQIGGSVGQVLNQVMGLNERVDTGAIAGFIKRAAGINIDPRVTPWCAAFVNAVLGASGIDGTGKLNARSFLNFGVATDNPKPGDVVVLSRGNDPSKGHVGFFNGYDAAGNILVAGGNQGNAVNVKSFPADAVLGFRSAGNVSGRTAQMPNYTPQGLGNIYENLMKIKDPEEREATRKSVEAYYTMRKKAMDAEREQVENWASTQIVQNPAMDILSMPLELQEALGPSGMTTLLEYQKKVQTAGEPTTDERVLYELQTQYAQDPVGFGETDLFQYRDKLSDDDWKTVTGWRQTALTDKRKAVEDGANLTTAFSQATQSLEAVGITATGLKGTQKQAADARIAEFQKALTIQIQEFKSQNDGRNPNQMDIQSMVNRLLLPVVLEEPGALWGKNQTKGKFLFEAGQRADGQTVDVVVEYEDIPVDLRRGISADLERELGRKPSRDEVANRYEQFILGQ